MTNTNKNLEVLCYGAPWHRKLRKCRVKFCNTLNSCR